MVDVVESMAEEQLMSAIQDKPGNTSYSTIFKTTFLFGFVQVFNIIVKVVINKIVALFLGTSGMGVIGLYNNSIHLLRTGAGLGISQSAVRDVSEAYASGNKQRLSRIISLTNNVIYLTSLLGIALTIILSPLLSNWSFGDNSHIIAYIWLSIVVGLNILSEGQLAILKGVRHLKSLAKASLYGSIVGLLSAVPFYFFFREKGIIPSLFVTSFAALFFSNKFVSEVKYDKVKLSIKELFKESSSMVKMGFSLMIVSFIASLFDLAISAYISNYGGLSEVGVFHAGATIVTSYFGVIITSMSTDYYPRISAVHTDNSCLQDELNKQSETGLIISFPLVVLFVFFSSLFIELLYSQEFIRANEYTDYAMIGTVIIIVSNCMGMILLAKQASKIYLTSIIIQRLIVFGIYVLFYNLWGIKGIGFAYVFRGLLDFVVTGMILWKFYTIRLNRKTVMLLLLVLSVTILMIFVRSSSNILFKYSLGSMAIACSSIFTLMYMKKNMNLDVIGVLFRKIKRSN